MSVRKWKGRPAGVAAGRKETLEIIWSVRYFSYRVFRCVQVRVVTATRQQEAER